MKLNRASIPVGFAWTSPFARWQGALSDLPSLTTAELVTQRALAERGLPPDKVDTLVLGWTVPQEAMFYGAPTLAARIGAGHTSGPMISQACATSVACVQQAASAAEAGDDDLVVVVAADRTSNGPHLVYPAPSAPGGKPVTEDWVADSFRRDPVAQKPMVATAEAVAAEAGFARQEIDDLTLLRYQQYANALADGRSAQQRYMVPVEIPQRRGAPVVVDADEGVHQTTAEGLMKLAPVDPGGVITYGSQTHPADGCAGMVVTSPERARELSRGGGVVRLLATGHARVGKGLMPKAPVPAALSALKDAGLEMGQVDAVTTHNPFAVNDLYFAAQTGYPLDRMNLLGSSLIYGHPQAPTGARLIAELIDSLVQRGGGVGLFTGCAAGDTGAALVLRVED